MTGTDWENELRELVRKLKEHVVTVEQYNAERRRLAPKAPNATAFAAAEERLFSVALDIEASEEAIYARAEGPPDVVPRPKEDDSEQRAASVRADAAQLTPEPQEELEASIGFVQRVAMKIVSLPKEQRTEQYAVVRRNLEASIKKHGVEGDAATKWLDLQMEGLQALVSEIEAAGGAAGGKA
jgi:hypothetical protein